MDKDGKRTDTPRMYPWERENYVIKTYEEMMSVYNQFALFDDIEGQKEFLFVLFDLVLITREVYVEALEKLNNGELLKVRKLKL